MWAGVEPFVLPKPGEAEAEAPLVIPEPLIILRIVVVVILKVGMRKSFIRTEVPSA